MDQPALVKYLRYQSWYRGTRENDLLLGQFADQTLSSFDLEQLRLYQQLLEEPDQDIFAWVLGTQPTRAPYTHLIKEIQTYHDQK